MRAFEQTKYLTPGRGLQGKVYKVTVRGNWETKVGDSIVKQKHGMRTKVLGAHFIIHLVLLLFG